MNIIRASRTEYLPISKKSKGLKIPEDLESASISRGAQYYEAKMRQVDALFDFIQEDER